MMYLENVTTTQTKFLPRHRNKVVNGLFRISLVNTVSRRRWTAEATLIDARNYMWEFGIQLPEGMENGEYEYELLHSVKVYNSGIAHIGEYHTERSEYNGNSEVIQYGG